MRIHAARLGIWQSLHTHLSLSGIVVVRSFPACQKLEASFAIDLEPGYGVQKARVKKKRVGKTKLTKIIIIIIIICIRSCAGSRHVVGRSAERQLTSLQSTLPACIYRKKMEDGETQRKNHQRHQ